MRIKEAAILTFFVASLLPVSNADAENGAFSSYLVGTYEKRFNGATNIQIINPTTNYLNVYVTFYDDQENCKLWLNVELSPNDLEELSTLNRVLVDLPTFGVVKIISHRDNAPFEGIVGFQTQCIWGMGCVQSNLAGIPNPIASEEIKKIMSDCGIQ